MPGRSPIRCGPTVYHEINNFYTATVYEKGAEVVRMLKTLLGPGGFRAGMDLYFERHDGEAATVEQFMHCFADASGADLTQFMLWYSQAGTPEVVGARQLRRAGADLSRSMSRRPSPPTPGQPAKEPMVIPLAIGLVGADGRDLSLSLEGGRPVVRGVLTLTQGGADLHLRRMSPSVRCRRSTRGFSAPVSSAPTSRRRGSARSSPRTIPIRSTAGRRRRRSRHALLIDNVAAIARRRAAARGRRA